MAATRWNAEQRRDVWHLQPCWTAWLPRVEAELGEPLTVVATGGLAPCIMPCCTRKVIYDSDLLFKGLAILYSKNAE